MTPFLFLFLMLVAPALPSEHGGEDSLAKAERLYDQGSSFYDAADYSGAIKSFTEALALVNAADSPDADTIKRPLLWNIAIAHERAFAVDGDAKHLRQAQILYGNYVLLLREDEAEAHAEARAHLDQIQALLTERVAPTETPVEQTSPSADPPLDRSSRKPLRIGVGLVVPGIASLTTGAVLLGVGSTYGSKAQAQVDMLASLGVPRTDPAWDQGARFVAQERRKGYALMATGGAALGVGVALTAVGSYYLAKHRHRVRSRATLTPIVRTTYFGLTLAGKF